MSAAERSSSSSILATALNMRRRGRPLRVRTRAAHRKRPAAGRRRSLPSSKNSVPAWNTSAPATASAPARVPISPPRDAEFGRDSRAPPAPPRPRPGPPAQIEPRKLAVAGGQQRRQQVGVQARQQRLASGSPKRTLNSISFGPSAVSISPATARPGTARPARASARQRRADDPLHRRPRQLPAEPRRRRNTHPCRRCSARYRRRPPACGPAPRPADRVGAVAQREYR